MDYTLVESIKASGVYGVSEGFPCNIYGKGLQEFTEKSYNPQKERFCMFWGNPVISTACRETPMIHTS
jgi:hypothetical protein